MTIGTGIGGGLILDGQLYHGSADVAGEIGHATIDITGRRCKCGNYGCLEAYASGPSIAERAREALGSDTDSLLYTLVHGDPKRIARIRSAKMPAIKEPVMFNTSALAQRSFAGACATAVAARLKVASATMRFMEFRLNTETSLKSAVRMGRLIMRSTRLATVAAR